MLAIERAVLSLGNDRFRDEYWDRAPVCLPGMATDAEVDSVLRQMSEFLDRTDIRYPSLRLAKDGAEIPLSAYTRELRLGPHTSHDWIVNEMVFAHYLKGATIILQMLQNSMPAFGATANQLEEFFGSSIQASSFVTPPNSQGFTAHYDTYSFFAVQLFGSKQWSLYDSTDRLPIRDDRADDRPWQPVPAQKEVTLRRGDVMYVPRGMYHSAVASTEASVHVTIGIFDPNWLDAIKASVSELGATAAFRSSIRTRTGESLGHDTRMLELLQSKLNLDSGVEALKRQMFSRHTDSREGRLNELLALSTSQLLDSYERQPIPYKTCVQGDELVLQFANKEMRLPSFVEPVIDAIGQTGAFAPLDLPTTLDDESLRFLLRKLLAEGFIRSKRTP